MKNPSFRHARLVLATLAVFGLLACGLTTLRGQAAAPTSATPTPSAGEGSNLVSNGDFQSATTDPTWPDNWAKGAGITYETEDGKHFLRLTQTEPGKMLMAYREISILPGVTKLTITLRFRSSNIAVGAQKYMDARAIFHFIDSSRKIVKGDPKTIDMTKDADSWTEKTEVCDVPSGAEKLQLMPSLFQVSAGTLDLAEVSVTPTP
jgi:endoglucanase